jgi:phytochelatin synthase
MRPAGPAPARALSRGSGRRIAQALACFAWIAFTASFSAAEQPKPKLGPAAISLAQSHDYLQSHRAPDYWALSPYYVPQATASACSLAAIAMLVNALRGLPAHAAEALVTQQALLEAVGSKQWAEETAERGSGVSWDEFENYLRLSLEAFRLDAEFEILRPHDASASTLAQLKRMLIENEASDRDIVVVYFDQGVLTGDWDGPHISPIAAYDADRGKVLIMDVDRQWYMPYWSSDQALLDAMLRPAPFDRGRLAGETGGLVRVTRKPR